MSVENFGNSTLIPEKNIQNKKEELSVEDKEQAFLAWKEMVLGVETMPDNIDQLKDLEVRKWFSQSLDIEIDNPTDKLSGKWGDDSSYIQDYYFHKSIINEKNGKRVKFGVFGGHNIE